MGTNSEIVIIGAGLVGLSTAYQLLSKEPELNLTILEKESGPAVHQSGRNSGVLHTGIYYKPGSLRAKYCRRGKALLEEFARNNGVEFELCGKVIVATKESELAYLDDLLKRGQENGIPELRKLSKEELIEIEPAANGIAAIHVPTAGIIDFPGVAKALVRSIEKFPNTKILFNEKLLAVSETGGKQVCRSSSDEINADLLINCAGLQSDRVANSSGTKPSLQISPFRGDYFVLSDSAASKVKGLIYPVPDPQFPFLGVHVTRMIDGSVECGPSAVPCLAREGYSKWQFSLSDCLQSATYAGTWKMFLKHWRYGMNEIHRSVSKRQFLRDVRKLLPDIDIADLCEARSGIRAVALQPDGEVLDDFFIEESEQTLHVLNAPSPAATACLAIGEHVATQAINNLL